MCIMVAIIVLMKHRGDLIATVNLNKATIQSVTKQDYSRAVVLPYRHQIQVVLLHPSRPLFFVNSGIKGSVDCVSQDTTVRTLVLSDSTIRLLAVDDTLLVGLSQ